MGDNLQGYGAGQTDSETLMYIMETTIEIGSRTTAQSRGRCRRRGRFTTGTSTSTLSPPVPSAAKIVGDSKQWAWFSRSELMDAIGNSTLGVRSFPNTVYTINARTSFKPNKSMMIFAHFEASRKLTLTLGLSQNGINSTRSMIYSELSTPSDLSRSAIVLLSHDGSNVFVRNSNASKPLFSMVHTCLSLFEECGDGFRTLPEECDDGNTRDGDGCSSTCKIEPGFYCKRGSYNDPSQSDYPCCDISCEDCTISGLSTCTSCRSGFVKSGLSCVGTIHASCNHPNRDLRRREKHGPTRLRRREHCVGGRLRRKLQGGVRLQLHRGKYHRPRHVPQRAEFHVRHRGR